MAINECVDFFGAGFGKQHGNKACSRQALDVCAIKVIRHKELQVKAGRPEGRPAVK